MSNVNVGELARAMSAAMRTVTTSDDGSAHFVPRVICLTARVHAPASLAQGWKPHRQQVVIKRIRWQRWWSVWRSVWPFARDRSCTPLSTLIIAATATRVRISLNGVPADASEINERSVR